MRAEKAVVVCFGCKRPLFTNNQLLRCYNISEHTWKWPQNMKDDDWGMIDGKTVPERS